MEEAKFLGKGMKFPPQIDPGTGRFAVASGNQSVRESVYIILMTARGERWLQPDFGSRLMSYTFMDTSPTMLGLMKSDLTAAILEQEPRVSDVQITMDANSRPGCLLVDVQCLIAGENTVENLVFPFYLNAVSEEASDESIQ